MLALPTSWLLTPAENAGTQRMESPPCSHKTFERNGSWFSSKGLVKFFGVRCLSRRLCETCKFPASHWRLLGPWPPRGLAGRGGPGADGGRGRGRERSAWGVLRALDTSALTLRVWVMRAPGISLFLFSPQAVPVARLARAMRGARSLWRVRPEPRVRSAGHGPRVTARAARHLLCAESSSPGGAGADGPGLQPVTPWAREGPLCLCCGCKGEPLWCCWMRQGKSGPKLRDLRDVLVPGPLHRCSSGPCSPGVGAVASYTDIRVPSFPVSPDGLHKSQQIFHKAPLPVEVSGWGEWTAIYQHCGSWLQIAAFPLSDGGRRREELFAHHQGALSIRY